MTSSLISENVLANLKTLCYDAKRRSKVRIIDKKMPPKSKHRNIAFHLPNLSKTENEHNNFLFLPLVHPQATNAFIIHNLLNLQNLKTNF